MPTSDTLGQEQPIDNSPAEHPAPPVVRPRGSRKTTIVVLAAVVTLPALLLGALYINAWFHPVYVPGPHAITAEEEHARDLALAQAKLVLETKEAGLAACTKKEWDLCLRRLREAEYDDPAVALDMRVIQARRAEAVWEDEELLKRSGDQGW